MKSFFVIFFVLFAISSYAKESPCKGTCYFYGPMESVGYPLIEKVAVALPHSEDPYSDLIQECEQIHKDNYGDLKVQPGIWVLPHPSEFLEITVTDKEGGPQNYVFAKQYPPIINANKMCD